MCIYAHLGPHFLKDDFLVFDIFLRHCALCSSEAEWQQSQTCDQHVAGSNPGRHATECNSGQVVYTQVPLSPSSIIWYQPIGGDAWRLRR